MIKNTLVVSKNTFTEALRQPIYIVIIIATIILFVFTPSLVMFTIREDNKLMWDIGLSNLLVAGLFIAIFSASTVVTDEIDRKTALTVISKTVSRPAFVIGKFLGVTGAVILAQYLLILVYFMTVRHGVLESAAEESDMTVITFGVLTALISIAVGALGNYFYKWRFGTTTVFVGTLLSTISILVLYFIDKHWQFNPAENHFQMHLIGPVLLIVLASITFSAIAVTVAMRFNMVTTMIVCAIAFLLGTMVHYKLGPIVSDPQGIVTSALAWVGLAVIPSINLFVVTDAVYSSKAVPMSYLLQTALYTALYTMGALTVAIMLFRKRDIG